MLAAVSRIARSVSVPVTADIENGYGLPPAELAARLAEAGVAGCNLEDSDPVTSALADPARQADYLAAVRAAAGPALVVNARVDVYVRAARSPACPGAHAAGGAPAGSAATGEALTGKAVERANRYLEAALTAPTRSWRRRSALPALVRRINGPVNALFVPGGPGLAELAAIGVARITFGGGLHRQARRAVVQLAAGLAAEVNACSRPEYC